MELKKVLRGIGIVLLPIVCVILFFLTVYFITSALLSAFLPVITNETVLINSHSINTTITVITTS